MRFISVFSFFILIIVVLVNSSCTAPSLKSVDEGINGKVHSGPSLPNYKVGTKFIYSNGSWEKVTEIGHDYVKWVNHRGRISKGAPDFIFKHFEWKSKKRWGKRSFTLQKELFGESSDSIWPLEKGRVVRFEEYGRWYEGNSQVNIYDYYWRCEVKATEHIKLSAGDFDTWKIRCDKYPDGQNFPKPDILETKTYYYAPIIQHWVLEIRNFWGSRPEKRKELVAVIPDLNRLTENPIELDQIKEQFQATLNQQKRGVPAIWSAKNANLIVSITPKRLYRHSKGRICRQYDQLISKLGVEHEFHGIACKVPGGNWQIPRL